MWGEELNMGHWVLVIRERDMEPRLLLLNGRAKVSAPVEDGRDLRGKQVRQLNSGRE